MRYCDVCVSNRYFERTKRAGHSQQVGGGPVEPSRDVPCDVVPFPSAVREVVRVAENERDGDEHADQQRGANEG